MLKPAGRAERYDLSHPNARRGRGRDKKFIPDADSDFALMGMSFALRLVNHASTYHIAPDAAREIAEAVETYRAALSANLRPYTKSRQTADVKNAARERAERLIREAANLIRANRQIDSLAKTLLGVKERTARPRRRQCPQTAPALSFVGAVSYANTIDGMHVIRFRDPLGKDSSDAKPAGAVRLELYYDLVPPGEPVPQWPGQRTGGVRLYLRSFTRSPLTVAYPKCDVPMRVVYWGCWADATGEQGPFSPTLATRVEGYDRVVSQLPGRREQKLIITSGLRQLPDLMETIEINDVDETRLLPDESSEAA